MAPKMQGSNNDTTKAKPCIVAEAKKKAVEEEKSYQHFNNA